MTTPDAALYTELLLTHRDFVRSIAGSLLADPHAADDVTQDTLIAAFERPPKPAIDPRAWLYAVVRNFTRQSARGEARRRQREMRSARGERLPSTSEIMEREALRASVVQAVLRLTEPSRSAILLRFYENKAPREIAAVLDVPVETVRTRIKRGLAALRVDLSNELAKDGGDWQSVLAPIAAAKTADGGRVPSASTTKEFAEISMRPALVKAALWSAGVVLVCAVGWIATHGARGASSSPIVDVERSRESSTPAVVASDLRPPRVELDANKGESTRTPLATREPSPAPAVSSPAQAATAHLRVSARMASSNAPVPEFKCGFWRASDGLRIPSVASVDGRVDVDLAFAPETESDEFAVYASTERLGGSLQRVRLAPGDDASVEVMFRAPSVVTGTVVDASGFPIDGALVYAGTEIRMRGDEPFKPFEPNRFESALETDSLGHFELETRERYVSVWHAEWSPRTVPVDDAKRIVLEYRATLRARLTEHDGAPLAGISVALDRARTTTTDAQGVFEFDRVEGGVRGIKLPDKRWLSIDVVPGVQNVFEFSYAGLLSVDLELHHGDDPFRERIDGLLVPLDRFGGICEVKGHDGAMHVEGVVSARYVLLSKSGTTGLINIGGPSSRIDVGEHALTVRATPGTRVYLVPRGSNELVQLLAGRAASQFVPASGEFRYSRVPAGRWSIGIDSHGIQADVEIGAQDVEVALDD